MSITVTKEALLSLRDEFKKNIADERPPTPIAIARTKDLTAAVLTGEETAAVISDLGGEGPLTVGSNSYALSLLETALNVFVERGKNKITSPESSRDLQRMVSLAVFESRFVRVAGILLVLAYSVAGGALFYASYESFGKAGAVGELVAKAEIEAEKAEAEVQKAETFVKQAETANNRVNDRIEAALSRYASVEERLAELDRDVDRFESTLEAKTNVFDMKVIDQERALLGIVETARGTIEAIPEEAAIDVGGIIDEATSQVAQKSQEFQTRSGLIDKTLTDLEATTNDQLNTFNAILENLTTKEKTATDLVAALPERLDTLIEDKTSDLSTSVEVWVADQKTDLERQFETRATEITARIDNAGANSVTTITGASTSQQARVTQASQAVSELLDEVARLEDRRRAAASDLTGIELFKQDLSGVEGRIVALQEQLAGLQADVQPVVDLSTEVRTRGVDVGQALENALAGDTQDFVTDLLLRLQTSTVLIGYGAVTLVLFFLTWIVLFRRTRVRAQPPTEGAAI